MSTSDLSLDKLSLDGLLHDPSEPNLLGGNNLQPPVEKDPISKGYKFLTPFQEAIVVEAYAKSNGSLALPMGTGKTFISLLVAIMQRKNESKFGNPILVVAAKTIIGDWKRDLGKFFGDTIKFQIIHQEHYKDMASWNPISEGCDVVLTTPQFCQKYYKEYRVANKFTFYTKPKSFGPEIKNYRYSDKPFINYTVGPAVLYSITWSVLIVDEAHMYCNINTGRCLGIASICAEFRWLLSGTLFDEPKIHKIFGYYLLLNHKPFPRTLPQCKKLITDKKSDFKGTLETCVYREKNDDFDLNKLETNVNKVIISHSLGVEEAKIYSNFKLVLNLLKDKLQQYKDNNDTANVKKFSSYVLAMISHLRQCLICPLLPITSVSIKIADVECKSELAQIFMDNINSLNLQTWLDNPNSLCSSRMQAVIQQLNNHPSQRIVIFSCYRSVLDILSYYIGSHREQFTISGNHKMDKRAEIVEKFSKSDAGLLLLTYEIGSNGLNLQCSDTVVLIDFWWNAGKSEQAICRILRRGQQASTVNIYYFTANTGMENALFKVQESKKNIAKELLTGQIESSISKIGTADILRLIDQEDNVNILTSISNI